MMNSTVEGIGGGSDNFTSRVSGPTGSTASKNNLYGSASWFLIAFSFLIPLKLSLAYCSLYPFLVISFVTNWANIVAVAKEQEPVIRAFLVFFVIAFLSTITGIDPLRSLVTVPSVLLYSLVAPLVAAHIRRPDGVRTVERSMWALISGQTLAAVHSVLNSAYGDKLPKFLIGSVTESGQLSLLIPFVFGLLVTINRGFPPFSESISYRQKMRLAGMCIGMCLFTLVVGFAPESEQTVALLVGALVLLATFVGINVYVRSKVKELHYLYLLIIPLLLGALFVNLKRGPWLGVACGMALFILLANRRLLLPVIVAGLLTVTLVPQVRLRLVNSAQDFFMSGGRSDIWEIGTELIQRYPLGIGYKNSPFLKKFNSEIPPELKHFHNNFLNILVETGWLGLLAYLYFFVVTIKKALSPISSELKFLSIAIAASLVSWQVAGIVEYSFGDSEVVLVSYLLIGVLLGLHHYADERKRLGYTTS